VEIPNLTQTEWNTAAICDVMHMFPATFIRLRQRRGSLKKKSGPLATSTTTTATTTPVLFLYAYRKSDKTALATELALLRDCPFINVEDVENYDEQQVLQRIRQHKQNGGADVILNCHAGGTMWMRMGRRTKFNIQEGFVGSCTKLGVRLMVLACHAGQLKRINGPERDVCTIQTEYSLSFALFRNIVAGLVAATTYSNSWVSIPTLNDETNDAWLQRGYQREMRQRGLAQTGAVTTFAGFDDLLDDEWN